jgi:hypothetical protein
MKPSFKALIGILPGVAVALVLGGSFVGSARADGTFINLNAAGTATTAEVVRSDVRSPWSDPAFREKYPDLIYAAEIRCNLLPIIETKTRGTAGGKGAAGRLTGAAGGIKPPRVSVTVRPGF